jgi:hypothetical protein
VAPRIDEVYHFTAAPITNRCTLSAVNCAILRIASLAAPRTGTVSAGAGSTVNFTSTFAQTAAAPIAFAVGGADTLAGTLGVKFADGFTPAAAQRRLRNRGGRTLAINRQDGNYRFGKKENRDTLQAGQLVLALREAFKYRAGPKPTTYGYVSLLSRPL